MFVNEFSRLTVSLKKYIRCILDRLNRKCNKFLFSHNLKDDCHLHCGA